MTEDEKSRIKEIRSLTVIKANELIQSSRFSLTLVQQRIVYYLISKVTPYDSDFKLHEFNIKEFCEVCGLDSKNGKNYIELKKAIKGIRDQSVEITLPDGRETFIAWIEKPYFSPDSGIVQIRLDADMKPYLLKLKSNFTQIELIWTLCFEKKYSLRLYEFIKSIHFNEVEQYSAIFDLDVLKKALDAEKYTRYIHFKDRVLVPAIEEINKFSDKIVQFEPIKEGRNVAQIKLTIRTKEAYERVKQSMKNNYDLDEKKTGTDTSKTPEYEEDFVTVS